MSIVTLRWMVFVMMALVNFVSADVLPSKSIDVDMVGPCLSRHQAWHPRVFYGFPSHTSPAELPFMGRGVRIAVLDTGIADEYVKRSASHMECHSFVPGVACGDQGCEHGTVSASILAGRIYVAGLPPEDSTPPQTVAPSSWKHATTDVRIDHEYVGIAPESHLTMMRVFDHQGRTTPAYLLRALQAARRMRADVISLSYGTEGGMDSRVRTLLKELAASGVVIVAAAGNAGPRFGSVLSPGDMAEVLTVGSMSVECFRPHTRCELVRRVAHFSGRGPTLDEQPYGSGRVKPDVVALGTSILAVREEVGNSGGANNFTRLRLVAAHGTSASTPLVAGLVALCIQALRHHGVESIHAAAIKSVIMTTARIITPPTFVAHTFLGANYSRQFHQSYQRTMDRYVHLLSYSMMSQGAGEVNLLGALQHIQTMQLQQWSTYVLPSRMHLNGTSACAYDWPMCAQPLYPGGLPQRFNFTTVVSPPSKGTGLTVRRSNTSFSVLSVEVGSKSAPLEWVNRFATMLLVLEVEAPLELASSYTGTIGVLVSCPEAAAEVPMPDGLHLPNGLLLPAGGDVSVEIVGEMRVEYCQEGNTCTQLPVPFSVSVVPPPPREQRVLLDSAHQWFNPKTTAQHARNVSQDVFVAGDDPHEGVPFTDGATSHLSREYAERDGDGLTTSGALVYLFLRHELHLFVHDFPLLLSDEVVEGLQLQDASATHRDQLRQRIGRVQQEVLQRRIGSIIMLDGEVPLSTETRKLLADASRNHGLNILLLTDWYSVELAQHLRWSGGEEQEGADELRAWHPLGHHGLAGSTHIPSINALLRQELQLPSLQLSESEVVDGVLAIPDEMGGWRGVGRLNGAGVLLHDLNHSIAPPPTGASIAVCNTHPTWSLRQRQLRKEAIPQATEMLRDVWVRLNHTPPHQHRGVFGFVTSTNPSMGRVTIFTDTNCLSAADPYILREVRGRITHRGHHPLNQTLQLGVTELHVPGHACLEVLRELMSAVLGGRITWTAHLTSSGGSTDHCSARHPSLPLTWAKEKQTPALVCSCSHGSASHTIATSVVPKKQNWSAAAPPLLEHRLHTAVTVWELFLRRWSTTASVSPETSNSVSTTSAPRTLRNLRKDTHASDPFPLTHHHQLPILASVLMLSVAAASVILIAARIKRQGRWRQRRLHRHHQWVD